MPHILRRKWPRVFGFDISGRGPSYVTAVEKGGSADRAGLLAGDHILGVNNQDVRRLPAETVKTVARQSRVQPPTLSVVSHLHQVDMSPDPVKGFGFSVRDDHPIVIGKIEPGSPAASSGLAEGDIILGVNGHPVQSLEALGSLLEVKPGRLRLLFIPVGRDLQATPTHPRLEVRVHRARQLHKKLNEVLGEDYEKKMAVVGVLKQYAENRNIVMLCSALLTILKSPSHRKLLREFRLYIPMRHRAQFDRIVQDFDLKERASEGSHTVGTSPQPSHLHSYPHPAAPAEPSPPAGYGKRTCHLSKTSEGYGFVLKGANPVHLESVDEGKSAARAGLQAGDIITAVNHLDVRSQSHQAVVQMLRNCEGEVTLEILRQVDEDGTQTDTDLSSMSSGLTTSWIGHLQNTVDTEGRTFKQRMEYLLTPRERLELKGAVQEYRQTRDITRFCVSVDRVLDTPSKRSLWLFLRVHLPPDHQQYCLQNSQLATVTRHDRRYDQRTLNGPVSERDVGTKTLSHAHQHDSPRSRLVMGTKTLLQQQQMTLNSRMADLLTPRERSQLNKALRHYSENRKVHLLIEELEELLDTPDKQRLWVDILPVLEPDHQQVLSAKYSPTHTAHSVYSRDVTFLRQSPDAQKAALEPPLRSYTVLPGITTHTNTEDFHIIGEAAASIRTSSSEHTPITSDVDEKTPSSGTRTKYQKHLQQNNSRATYHITVPFGKIHHGDQRLPDVEKKEPPVPQTSHLDKVLVKELQKTRKAVTEAKQVIVQASSASRDPGLAGELTLPGKDSDKRYITFVPVGYPGLENQPYKAVELNSPDLNKLRKFGPAMLEAQSDGQARTRSRVVSGMVSLNNGHYSHRDSESSDMSADTDRDSSLNTAASHQNKTGGYPPSTHSAGSNSVNGQAIRVLQQLDAAMETEMQESSAKGRLSRTPVVPAPPPPPPPAAPHDPALPISPQASSMSVKRINWEKLSADNIQDTVWGQIGDTEHLDEVIEYLELEQQFSTTPVKSGNAPTEKKEINLILSPKKAYNISILLGHLKLTATEMTRAFYSMDELILTPELLKQLLIYAPSQQEMSRYASLSADASQLTLPDQFAYKMSQIPEYLNRLKAMGFRASFEEKYDEIKEALSCISKASKELRWSKHLAKILELILAMGNHLNKGNTRVGQASGFRISYLSQLDVTKTQDNKHTFLHVLANASLAKVPDTLAVGRELKTVPKAAKVSLVTVTQELEDMKGTFEEVSAIVQSFQAHCEDGSDKFYQVMHPFLGTAKGKLGALVESHRGTREDYSTMVQYFGEDPAKMQTTEIFTVFSEFITKFENAHRENLNAKVGGRP